MNKQISKPQMPNLPNSQEIFDSAVFHDLSPEAQEALRVRYAETIIDLNAMQQKQRIEHTSAINDLDVMIEAQEILQTNQDHHKGLGLSYHNIESRTSTSEIKSRTTHATASSGCLLPVLLTIGMLLILSL